MSTTPAITEVKVHDERDPLLALRGSGKDLWADEHADDYVQRLRGGREMCDQLGPSGYPPAKPAAS